MGCTNSSISTSELALYSSRKINKNEQFAIDKSIQSANKSTIIPTKRRKKKTKMSVINEEEQIDFYGRIESQGSRSKVRLNFARNHQAPIMTSVMNYDVCKLGSKVKN